ncbi:MAG: hypothetical protein ABSF77_02815 [Spirochaetia bacterium]
MVASSHTIVDTIPMPNYFAMVERAIMYGLTLQKARYSSDKP